MPSLKTSPRAPWFLVGVFFLIIFTLFILGHFYYSHQKQKFREEQYRLISAITRGKANEFRKWIDERRSEGVFLMRSPNFTSLVQKIIRNPENRNLRQELKNWLCPIRENHDYTSICLYTGKGDLIYGCGEPIPLSSRKTDSLIRIIAPDNLSSTNLVIQSRDSSVFIDFTFLIKDVKAHGAFLVFRIDPSASLVPVLTISPLEYIQSTTYLIKKDNARTIRIRPDVKHANTSLMCEIQSGKNEAPGDIPLEGTLTWLEGSDENGKQVMADVKQITGTDWAVVSSIYLNDLYMPLRKLALNVIMYLLIFLALILIIGFLVWKSQQVQFFRNRLQLQMDNDRAEEKLRFMSALMQEVNDAIITFDKDLMILSWNKGAERIYGWKAEEVIGKYGGGSLHVDFPGPSREVVFKELEQKGFWKGEVIHKRKDGTTAYLLSSSSQLKDENGNILGVIAINKDISEVIHSEKIKSAVYRISELAHSTRDLEELFASIHVVIGELMDARNLFIAMLEPDRHFMSYPYFIDEKNQSPGKVPLGHGLTEHVLTTGKPLLVKPEDARYLAEHGVIDFSSSTAIDWLGIPLKYEQESFGVLVVQSYSPKIRYGERERDILLFVSEQIALSIHRKKMQQELIEAKQKAEVSSKLTSSLLANMNHELRTPMNGILGFAEILMNELPDPEARTKAENILLSGRRLMDTLDAIMDLSYLESDRVSRKFRPVSVNKVLKSVLGVYEPMIRRKNLSLVQQCQQDLMILGDEQLFAHLLRNLIDNAVKYTDQGTITVTATRIERGGTAWGSVSIKDTGIGISEENHRMIFEAFRQVSEGYGRQFEGSGLGLTLSRRITSLMNGEIFMTSKIGEGSVFTVQIPSDIGKVSGVLPEPTELRRVSPLEPVQESPVVSLPNVLIVEDNIVNLKLVMVYLKDSCNLFSALDGRTAIRMSRERKFDFILMDINLGPGMDGIQAMLEIRKHPDYKDTPIIAVTGYASIGDRDRLINIGFSGYIPKPFDRELILSLLKI